MSRQRIMWWPEPGGGHKWAPICKINKVLETWSAVGFGFYISELHGWSCVYHINCFWRRFSWGTVMRTWFEVWSCLLRIFLLLTDFPSIHLIKVQLYSLFVHKSFWPSSNLTLLYTLILFLNWNYFLMFQVFLGTQFYYGAIEVIFWGDREPATDISWMIWIKVGVK